MWTRSIFCERSHQMQQHILHRLLLAKWFFQDADRAARTSSNDLALSRVVVHLHDALDNLLGAVATERHLLVKPRDTMMEVFSSLVKGGHVGIGGSEIEQLNGMRNAVKHHGLPQNAGAILALIPVLRRFANDVAVDTFGV